MREDRGEGEGAGEGTVGRSWANAVTAVSQGVMQVEKTVAGLLMLVLLLIILANVVTRFLRVPLYWVDEAAVFAMIWLGFIGASVMTRLRIDFAVTLLADQMSPRNAARLKTVASALSFAFGIGLLVMCWNWMDPLGIAGAGFDAKAYAARSFNFLYTEHSQTLEWPNWVVYLVLPLFALTMTLHLAANLLEDLGLAARRPQIALTGSAEEAV